MVTRTKRLRQNGLVQNQALINKISFFCELLIAKDNPECEGYAILSMAMTDERGE